MSHKLYASHDKLTTNKKAEIKSEKAIQRKSEVLVSPSFINQLSIKSNQSPISHRTKNTDLCLIKQSLYFLCLFCFLLIFPPFTNL